MSNERIGSVTLTTVAGSPNYYARFRRNGRQVTRSLQTSDVVAARKRARDIDAKIPTARKSTIDNSFNRFALQTIEDDRRKVVRGERSESLVRDGRQILKTYTSPTLGDLDVRKIDYQTLKRFVDALTDKGLKVSSIKKVLVHVNKALTVAVQLGALPALPLMPKVEMKIDPRGWFTKEEYNLLLKECKRHERAATRVRSQTITSELRYFATFMVNTFLRPGDLGKLQHRHIEIVRNPGAGDFLRITTDFGKTTRAPVVSMPTAVNIYERIRKEQKAKGFGKPTDFLFMPAQASRDFAIKEFGRMFRVVLLSAGLETAKSGQARSVYSLRHTAIMFRLVKGNVDTLTLSRAARTSVEMIDRFYASHLTAEMNVDKLHQMR